MNALPCLLGGIVLAGCAAAAHAGTRHATFDVGITLLAYPHGTAGTCTSGATPGMGGGTVSVVCSGREFVAISAGPGMPPGSLSGRTTRVPPDGRPAVVPATAPPGDGTAAGQPSTWRVINVQGTDAALFVTVDF